MNKITSVFKSFKYYDWCAFALAALWLSIVVAASSQYDGVNFVELLALIQAISLCFFIWLSAAFRYKYKNGDC